VSQEASCASRSPRGNSGFACRTAAEPRSLGCPPDPCTDSTARAVSRTSSRQCHASPRGWPDSVGFLAYSGTGWTVGPLSLPLAHIRRRDCDAQRQEARPRPRPHRENQNRGARRTMEDRASRILEGPVGGEPALCLGVEGSDRCSVSIFRLPRHSPLAGSGATGRRPFWLSEQATGNNDSNQPPIRFRGGQKPGWRRRAAAASEADGIGMSSCSTRGLRRRSRDIDNDLSLASAHQVTWDPPRPPWPRGASLVEEIDARDGGRSSEAERRDVAQFFAPRVFTTHAVRPRAHTDPGRRRCRVPCELVRTAPSRSCTLQTQSRVLTHQSTRAGAKAQCQPDLLPIAVSHANRRGRRSPSSSGHGDETGTPMERSKRQVRPSTRCWDSRMGVPPPAVRTAQKSSSSGA